MADIFVSYASSDREWASNRDWCAVFDLDADHSASFSVLANAARPAILVCLLSALIHRITWCRASPGPRRAA